MSFFAFAMSRVGHLRVLSAKGLTGEMGVQPTVFWPSHATLFSASRSMLRSSASRTRASLASGVPRSPGGLGDLPFLLWRLIVMPLYAMHVTLETSNFPSFLRFAASVGPT